MVPKLYDYLRGQASSGGKMQDFVDAQRLAYADRDHFFADPDWVDVPVEALLDQTYLRQRANARFAPDAVPDTANPLERYRTRCRHNSGAYRHHTPLSH